MKPDFPKRGNYFWNKHCHELDFFNKWLEAHVNSSIWCWVY